MKKATNLFPAENDEERVYQQVRGILTTARNTAFRAVNIAMVEAYWEIGRVIGEEEQRGASRADYGARLIEILSKRLTADFGKGFNRSNVFAMRQFFRAYPIVHALRGQLTWTHYRLLLRVENTDARSFYQNEAIAANWSTRELDRQINS